MTTLLNDKRWEMVLAALSVAVPPLLDAFQSGTFHGKSVVDGLVLAAIIAGRALASHKQSPPPVPPTP